jgi:Arc/MetJ family transcription regulator
MMTKRLVEIDDEVLEDARRSLGTLTIKDTVNTALAESVKAARRRAITKEDLQRVGELLQDLGDPEVMAKAWD